jgi:hypothetical protein
MLIGNGDYRDRDGGETELTRTMPRETEMVPVTADTRAVTETSQRYRLWGGGGVYTKIKTRISPPQTCPT